MKEPCIYHGTFGDRLAPDGSLMRENFARWFDGSKVVDAAGAPRLLIHGTSGFDFDAFHIYGFKSHFGTVHAAEDILQLHAGVIKSYMPRTLDYFAGSRMLPVYLSMVNPVRLSDLVDWDFDDVRMELVAAGVLDQAESEAIQARTYDEMDGNQDDGRELLRIALLRKGIDGIVYENDHEDKGKDSYIVFAPSQIKSALGNSGLFDAESEDISDGHGWNMPAERRLERHR